jgi:hypothetical protein
MPKKLVFCKFAQNSNVYLETNKIDYDKESCRNRFVYGAI